MPDNDKIDLRREIRKLKRLARNALITIAIASFVAMVTGTTLHLHLLGRSHSEEHDAERCSTCQKLLTAPGKFITEPWLIRLDHTPRTDAVEFISQSHVITFHFGPSNPRPPPHPTGS